MTDKRIDINNGDIQSRIRTILSSVQFDYTAYAILHIIDKGEVL